MEEERCRVAGLGIIAQGGMNGFDREWLGLMLVVDSAFYGRGLGRKPVPGFVGKQEVRLCLPREELPGARPAGQVVDEPRQRRLVRRGALPGEQLGAVFVERFSEAVGKTFKNGPKPCSKEY